ncbi:phasin family protein [Pseudorhodoferax sp. LjRoot39]|uniref:phasin family protein n=1 Tax=Pseudorhodoferax sp. LjRoot39 TaxID=3342328 RepID=UPI003ED0EDA0
MAKKPNPFNPFGDDASAAQFAESVRASAQQIWLAGLGAFAKAQAEGSKVFEGLVKEGADMQDKTQAAAREGLHEAGTRFGSMASEFGARAAGQWDKLEGIFEERVAKALRKLGVPRIDELEQLAARVDALERAAQRPATARKTTARPRHAAATPPAAPTKRAARKRPVPRKD